MSNDMFTRFGSSKIGRSSAFPIDHTVDGATALERAGIDWTVSSFPLAAVMPDNTPRADKYWVSVRDTDGTVVGVNGKRHHIIQNSVLAEFGDTIRYFRPDAKYVAGGERLDGTGTFLMLELDEGLNVGNNDQIRRQILMGTNHDGGSLFVVAVGFRPFCMNQWNALMRSKVRIITISHTASAEQRIRDASAILEGAVAQFDEMDEAIRRLIETPASIRESIVPILGERPKEEGRALTFYNQRVENLWAEYGADHNSDHVGTAFGVVMAAQGVDEHRGRCKRGMRDTQRVNRMVTANYPLMERAMKVLLPA
jgi:hypothetical protein